MVNLRNCKTYSFLCKVRDTILSNNMFQRGDRVLVAVSGGADSVALLYALYFLSNEFELTLGIAHLNHNLRGLASREDLIFVKSIANKLGLPFYCVTANILKVRRGLKLSIEESGRRVRYAFFRKIVIGNSFSKVALGHHMDDNAELILMFMFRGSGLKGLSGIPSVRDNCFVRPLIRIRKFRILEFLRREMIEHREDSSNNDLKFVRNNVRHRLIPLITESYNPKIVDNLNRMAILVSGENEYLDQIADTEYKKALVSFDDGMLSFSTDRLNAEHVAIKRRILRKALEFMQGSLKRITFTHIESIIGLLQHSSSLKRLDLPGSLKVARIYDRLELRIDKDCATDILCGSSGILFEVDIIRRSGVSVVLQDNKYRFNFSILETFDSFMWRNSNKNTAFLDLKFLQFPLFIRYVEAKDRIRPLGLLGSQNLKKYFSNKKVPLIQRSESLVVVDFDGNIVWLVAHAICDFAKVTHATRRILRIEFCLKNNR